MEVYHVTTIIIKKSLAQKGKFVDGLINHFPGVVRGALLYDFY